MLVLSFPESTQLASMIAEKVRCPHAMVAVHVFPDGESRLRIPSKVPEHVVLCRSLDHPNSKLIELMLVAQGARASGARRITLLAPYLCYMRQDKAFHPGEVVSQPIVGQFLASFTDVLATADPHLHRIANLEEAVPVSRAVTLSAAERMGEFLKSRGSSALLLGPDHESEQWVQAVAMAAGLDYAVAEKVRRGDREVSVVLPEGEYAGRDIVLVDDIASSGRTLAEASLALFDAGAKQVDALVTHGLFAEGALEALQEAGVGEVWSSDSITHSTNAFSLAEDFAAIL